MSSARRLWVACGLPTCISWELAGHGLQPRTLRAWLHTSSHPGPLRLGLARAPDTQRLWSLDTDAHRAGRGRGAWRDVSERVTLRVAVGSPSVSRRTRTGATYGLRPNRFRTGPLNDLI